MGSPMSSVLLFFVIRFVAWTKATASVHGGRGSCLTTPPLPIMSIGAVLDLGSGMGKQQKLAMEIAVQEFNGLSCSELVLNFNNSHGISAQAVAAAMDLVHSKKVEAIIGTITQNEATLAAEIINTTKSIPILSLTSPATIDVLSVRLPNFIQVGHDISVHLQCIAAIVGEHKWRKVTAIYEYNNGFSSNPGIITLLSYSLHLIGSDIDEYLALPSLYSLPNPETTLQKELERLNSKSSRVFLIVQSSLELATLLFEKAKQMGMMEKGYVWVIPDGVAGLLDSVDSSINYNMQGVIGFKPYFVERGEAFRRFKFKFQRKYMLEYPEEEIPKPGLFALRAYDATWAIALAAKNSKEKLTQADFLEKILSGNLGNFEGLSGNISIKDGKLLETPTFQIINVIGRSYRELALWSPAFGFTKNHLTKHQLMEVVIKNGSTKAFGTVFWPGGLLTVPEQRTYNNGVLPLRIGVPARGAFSQFVNVAYDPSRNETSITGFSIDVFKAAVKHLPYDLSFVFVPFNGSYDDMVVQVSKKEFDAAVGDTEIMAYRYHYAEFSQPYIQSGLEMVVPVRPDESKETWMFMDAFTREMWLITTAMHIFIGFVIWLIEREVNEELRGFKNMLWFLVTVLFYAHREPIRNNLARIVLAPWLFIILIITTSFTASLTSMLTISRLEPSVVDIQTLQKTNAPIGCNENSFIVRYLIDVLKFQPENIRKFNSISDYPAALKTKQIEAAFLNGAHAKVFLAMYSCNGFMKARNTFKPGGLGFVFPRGSTLTADISEAVLNVIGSGGTQHLEDIMLSNVKCSSSNSKTQDGSSLGVQPLFALYCICGTIAVLALFYNIKGLVLRHVQKLMSQMQEMIRRLWTRMAKFLAWSYSKFRHRSKRSSTVQQTNHSEEMAAHSQQRPVIVNVELVNIVSMVPHAPN